MTMSNARASRDKTTKDRKLTLPEVRQATKDQLREGYLQRLRRLLRLRRDHFEELNEQGLRLLDRSIFATYCDCIDIGRGNEARDVLKDVRLTVSLPKPYKR